MAPRDTHLVLNRIVSFSYVIVGLAIACLWTGGCTKEVPGPAREAAVLEAVRVGDCDTVARLLSEGADPNQYGPDGRGLLFRAIQLKRLDVAEVLVRHGADVNTLSSQHPQRPLEIAFQCHAPEDFIGFLISEGAFVNVVDSLGTTVLMRLAQGRDAGRIELLVALAGHKIDVCRRDNYGRDALFHAVQTACSVWRPPEELSSADGEVVSILLRLGANPDAETWTGQTALNLARRADRQDLVRLLLEGKRECPPGVQAADGGQQVRPD